MEVRMPTLVELLPEYVDAGVAEARTPIGEVAQDSREARPGTLFVAIRGLTVDGHDFIGEAVRAGASAVVAERTVEVAQLLSPAGREVPCVVVDDAARALGLAASRLHGRPSSQLKVVGITGTNGKTTTAYLLESMLQAAGRRVGMIGTVTYRYGDTNEHHSEPAPFTTPTPIALQGALARMVASRCDSVVMEVSSHGLQLGRLWGCDFDVAAFSHLTQDHLDLHGTMECYLEAKLLLFSRHLRSGGCAVINIDGAGADRVMAVAQARGDVRVIRCSRRSDAAEVRLDGTESSLCGLSGTLVLEGARLPIRSPLIGAHNADNLLLAAGCAHALGLGIDAICEGAAALSGVPGRLERVELAHGATERTETEAGFTVVVDFAHTPDALAHVLQTMRPLCQGRLFVLFGCGGDRDRGKRPMMGAEAARQADVVIVTSDNPRSEDPAVIIEAILEGVVPTLASRLVSEEERRVASRGFWVQPDRAAAIASAIAVLRGGDVLLIAGKGHEDYQIVGDERRPFDDRKQAAAALRARREATRS